MESDLAKSPKGRWGNFVASCCWLYAAAVALFGLTLRVTGDRYWFGTALLFGPRWLIALPLGVLLPAAALTHWRSLLVLLGTAIIVTFPILDFCIPFRGLIPEWHKDFSMRIMTLNGESASLDQSALSAFINDEQLDVVALEECDKEGGFASLWPTDWHITLGPGLCVASRFPIGQVDTLFGDEPLGGRGALMRCEISAPHPIVLYVVHLATPREGLEKLRDRDWEGAREELTAANKIREHESQIAKDWIGEKDSAFIIVGDFNMPVDSVLYRQFWSGYSNALSEAGFGFNYTKWTRWFGLRIDHVLASGNWRFSSARVGPVVGSDHRPVIADVWWQNGPGL